MTEQQIITEAESLLDEGLLLEIYRIFDQDESAYYDFCSEVMIGIYRSRGVQTEIYNASSERDSFLLNTWIYGIGDEASDLIWQAEMKRRFIAATTLENLMEP
ncbi:hypothetical protein [Aeromonas rivipollensis]|uniref:hypothetical protein n=1 Tax=Aeromonas rivipollensis TaxID=948519 RepID=UPI00297241BE|nr:hypothetical protein [Aeromonas rivipollensis]